MLVESSTMNRTGGAVIVNGAETIEPSPGDANANVRGPASPNTVSPVNVATPATAVTVVVPPSEPPPVAMATVTDALDDVIRFPAASRISTTGCGASGDPSAAPPGCVRKPSCDAAPGVTVTDTLVLTEALAAVIVAVPTLMAVTRPLLTVATVGSELVQMT